MRQLLSHDVPSLPLTQTLVYDDVSVAILRRISQDLSRCHVLGTFMEVYTQLPAGIAIPDLACATCLHTTSPMFLRRHDPSMSV